MKVLCLAFFISAFLFPAKAYCYLDPGTGSFVFQILITAVLGIVFSVKLFWNRIKRFFQDLFTKSK